MESIFRGLLNQKWQSNLKLVRYRSKPSVTKPKPPHFERALTEHICVPFFTKKKQPTHIPNFNACAGQVVELKQKKDHPLELILQKETLSYFENSKMVAFFHQNFQTLEEKFENKVLIKKSGMKLQFLKQEIVKKALSGTKYEGVLPLFVSPSAIAYSSDILLSDLLKVAKKLKFMTLIAAMVNDRLLSYSELEKYGKIANITQARLQLVGTLTSSLHSIVHKVNHHPSSLLQHLNQHKNILAEGSKKE